MVVIIIESLETNQNSMEERDLVATHMFNPWYFSIAVLNYQRVMMVVGQKPLEKFGPRLQPLMNCIETRHRYPVGNSLIVTYVERFPEDGGSQNGW